MVFKIKQVFYSLFYFFHKYVILKNTKKITNICNLDNKNGVYLGERQKISVHVKKLSFK